MITTMNALAQRFPQYRPPIQYPSPILRSPMQMPPQGSPVQAPPYAPHTPLVGAPPMAPSAPLMPPQGPVAPYLPPGGPYGTQSGVAQQPDQNVAINALRARMAMMRPEMMAQY